MISMSLQSFTYVVLFTVELKQYRLIILTSTTGKCINTTGMYPVLHLSQSGAKQANVTPSFHLLVDCYHTLEQLQMLINID
jgi:hypothetical protein